MRSVRRSTENPSELVHDRAGGGVSSGVTFEEFVASRLTDLLRHAAVLTGDRDLAQDIVQEVLARAQVKWRRITRADSPDAYLRRMIINEYLSWRRSWNARNVRAVGERLAAIGDSRRVGRDHAQDVVESDDLWRRLATLPRKQRAVLVLRYYEQLDDAAIADVLDCAPVTVRSNASKALKSLRLASRKETPAREKELR